MNNQGKKQQPDDPAASSCPPHDTANCRRSSYELNEQSRKSFVKNESNTTIPRTQGGVLNLCNKCFLPQIDNEVVLRIPNWASNCNDTDLLQLRALLYLHHYTIPSSIEALKQAFWCTDIFALREEASSLALSARLVGIESIYKSAIVLIARCDEKEGLPDCGNFQSSKSTNGVFQDDNGCKIHKQPSSECSRIGSQSSDSARGQNTKFYDDGLIANPSTSVDYSDDCNHSSNVETTSSSDSRTCGQDWLYNRFSDWENMEQSLNNFVDNEFCKEMFTGHPWKSKKSGGHMQKFPENMSDFSGLIEAVEHCIYTAVMVDIKLCTLLASNDGRGCVCEKLTMYLHSNDEEDCIDQCFCVNCMNSCNFEEVGTERCYNYRRGRVWRSTLCKIKSIIMNFISKLSNSKISGYLKPICRVFRLSEQAIQLLRLFLFECYIVSKGYCVKPTWICSYIREVYSYICVSTMNNIKYVNAQEMFFIFLMLKKCYLLLCNFLSWLFPISADSLWLLLLTKLFPNSNCDED